MLRMIKMQLQRLFVLIVMFFAALAGFPYPVGGAELSVTFTAPGDDGDVGTAASYLVYYATTPFDETNVDDLLANGVVDTARFCPLPDPAGTAQECTLTGLRDDTEYWSAIKAVDEAGNWSALSNVVSAVTRDVTGPARVMDYFMFAK